MDLNKELLDTHSPAEAGSLEDIQGCVDCWPGFWQIWTPVWT